MTTEPYFSKPPLDLQGDEVLCVSTLRDEALRLPFFLEYCRSLGVDHFLIVDNGSTDGSSEILAAAPDVTVFETSGSYRGSAAGREWMEELADEYADGHWILTLDVDELFVFPFCELSSLQELTTHLDGEGSKGMMCVFLDMYSDQKLSDTVATPGQSFLDVCPFYETDTYAVRPGVNPPFLSITGGPRWRLFWDSDLSRRGPMMKKTPLIKWHRGFGYLYSTHSHNPVQLSMTTGALLHFKFFSEFLARSTSEAERGDRRQPLDYSRYSAKLNTEDPNLFGPQSRRFVNSASLVRDGVCAVQKSWHARITNQHGDAAIALLRAAEPRPEMSSIVSATKRDFGLGAIGMIWPHVNHPVRDEFMSGRPQNRVSQSRVLAAAAPAIRFVDIRDQGIILSVNPTLWNYQTLVPGIAISINRVVVALQPFDRAVAATTRMVQALEAQLHIIPMPRMEQLKFTGVSAAGTGMQRLDIELVNMNQVKNDTAAQVVDRVAVNRGSNFLVQLDERMTERGDRSGMDGVVEAMNDFALTGWIVRSSLVDPSEAKWWRHPVSVYLNDWYIGEYQSDVRRKDLGRPAGEPEADGDGSGFRIHLPVPFFRSMGHEEMSVEIRAARRNLILRRSPVVSTQGSARWDAETESWFDT